jgi:GNAT superfamily N-acetyltransferase
MHIDYLANYMHLVPLLAKWHYDEWHHLTPWETLDLCGERLEREAQKGGVPTVLVAVGNGKLMGYASIVVHDMKGREDLTPWMAGVFVAPAYRRQGIGTKLVQGIVEEAGKQNVSVLYLYTTSKENEDFYARLGWSVKERVEYLGKLRVVMEIKP